MTDVTGIPVAVSSVSSAGRIKMAATVKWVSLTVQLGILVFLINNAGHVMSHHFCLIFQRVKYVISDRISRRIMKILVYMSSDRLIFPEYICPRPNDPSDYSECCSHVSPECCPPERHFYQIDNTLATAIAVIVSLTCLAATVAIIVCCFWSKCPLYNACRVQYSTQGEIIYGKENGSNNIMPSDTPSRKNNFSCPKLSLNSSKASLV
uniref:Uncharacterized protein n=1 Tax=Strigamia maritima TaxID=126957 RepID=T1J0F8_STRMM